MNQMRKGKCEDGKRFNGQFLTRTAKVWAAAEALLSPACRMMKLAEQKCALEHPQLQTPRAWRRMKL